MAPALRDRRRRRRAHRRTRARGLPGGARTPARGDALNHAARLEALATAVAEENLDALLVSDLVNVRYLTGFSGSNALLLVRPAGSTFLTDFRYAERAQPLETFVEVRPVDERLLLYASRHLGEVAPDAARLGFEAASLTFAAHRLLDGARDGRELVPTSGLVERLRMVKDADEQEAVRRAAAVLEPVLRTLASEGLAGRSEADVAWRIQELFHERGATGPSFPSIVAAQENGALPHAVPREVAVARNTLVTIDLGCILDGYCSDCTRTFATGPLAGDQAEIYDVCLRAQLAALDAVRPGVAASEVDRAARDVIEQAGYGGQFGHPTGHGVGLAVHEAPRLSASSDVVLAEGMVVTVEPGIYLPGRGGVRIEDLAIVTAEGAERLTGYPKELVTLA